MTHAARGLAQRLAHEARARSWVHVNSAPFFKSFAADGVNPSDGTKFQPAHCLFNTLMHNRSTLPIPSGDTPDPDPDIPLPMAHFWHDRENKALHAALHCNRGLSGNPGLMHGGISGLLVDELCGLLFVSSGLWPGFTANMSVNFRAKIALPAAVHGVARVESVRGRKVTLTAQLRSGYEADSLVYVDASCLYIRAK